MNKKTYIIAIFILIFDQIIKSLTEIYFKLNESVGGAWNFLENQSYLFIIFSIIALILLIKFMFSFKNNLRNNIAFACLYGGILSNLADRMFLGYVRDYLDFKIFSYDYPIFNIADCAIVIGVILLIIGIIKGEDKKHDNNK